MQGAKFFGASQYDAHLQSCLSQPTQTQNHASANVVFPVYEGTAANGPPNGPFGAELWWREGAEAS